MKQWSERIGPQRRRAATRLFSVLPLGAALVLMVGACGQPTSATGSPGLEATGAAQQQPSPIEETHPAGPEGSSAAQRAETECFATDELGEPASAWGDMTPEAQKLADQLSALVNDYPAEFAGVSFCGEFSSVAVFTVTDSPETLARIDEVSNQFPDIPVVTKAVGKSRQELEDAGRKVFSLKEYQGLVVGAGPDLQNGGISVDVKVPKDGVNPETLVNAKQLAEKLGVPVRLRAVVGAVADVKYT